MSTLEPKYKTDQNYVFQVNTLTAQNLLMWLTKHGVSFTATPVSFTATPTESNEWIVTVPRLVYPLLAPDFSLSDITLRLSADDWLLLYGLLTQAYTNLSWVHLLTAPVYELRETIQEVLRKDYGEDYIASLGEYLTALLEHPGFPIDLAYHSSKNGEEARYDREQFLTFLRQIQKKYPDRVELLRNELDNPSKEIDDIPF